MKSITLFTSKTWPYCKMAKEFLEENKIHYVERDINQDPEARKEMIRRKVTGVPTFLIGDDVVVGLDQAKVLSLADHRVVECSQCSTKMRVPVNHENIIIKCPNCKHIIE